MHTNFENNFSKFNISNGIVYFTYKPIALLDMEIAKAIVAERLKFQNGIAYPVLCDTRGIFDIERPAREYLAREGSTLITAVAILEHRRTAKTMLRFYLNINRPTIPTGVVETIEEGIDFLKAYSH